jgi:PAS domain-containing protein
MSVDGVMRRVNPGIKQVLGLAPEDVVGRPLLDMCHPAASALHALPLRTTNDGA